MFSGTTNPCPSIEIFATDSKIDGYECPVYATASSRLDPPLFSLITNEQIDPMTFIIFQNGIFFCNDKNSNEYFICLDNEEIARIPFPIVIRQEPEKALQSKSEINTFREMSPVSQLSQSTTDRTNISSVKDIQRDEPMLGFE